MSIGPAADVPEVGPDVPEPPATGDAPVDQALEQLAAAMTEQLEDQATAYDAVHRMLTDRLADVEG